MSLPNTDTNKAQKTVVNFVCDTTEAIKESNLQFILDIYEINETNVDETFNKIKESGHEYKFIINCIEYAIKVRPKQEDSLVCLLSKIAKDTGYTPDLYLYNEHKNAFKKYGLSREESTFGETDSFFFDDDDFGMKSFLDRKIVKIIMKDDVEEFIKFTSDPDFDPNESIEILKKDEISFVNGDILECDDEVYDEAGEISYMQIMAYFGALKCFKYALVNQEFDREDLPRFAVAGGNIEIIHLLEHEGESFDNCFDVSVTYHRDAISEWLLNNYKCQNIELYKAVGCFNIREFYYILKSGKTLSSEDINEAFEITIEIGNLPLIKYLIDNYDVDINQKDDFDTTYLHTAAEKGNVKVAQLLIEKGADIKARNKIGYTPLILSSNAEISKMLIEHGADIEEKSNNGTTPIIMAAASGYLSVVHFLADQGANIEAKERLGETPLYKAAQNGNFELLKFLIDRGADINQKSDLGYYPIMIALQFSHLKVFNFLIEHGADIHIKNNEGNTLLHIAASWGKSEIIKLLVEKGLDINAKNNKGYIPAETAAQNGKFNVLPLLKSKDSED